MVTKSMVITLNSGGSFRYWLFNFSIHIRKSLVPFRYDRNFCIPGLRTKSRKSHALSSAVPEQDTIPLTAAVANSVSVGSYL